VKLQVMKISDTFRCFLTLTSQYVSLIWIILCRMDW